MQYKLFSDIVSTERVLREMEEKSLLLIAACEQFKTMGERALAKSTVLMAKRNFVRTEEEANKLQMYLAVYRFRDHIKKADSEMSKDFMRTDILSAAKRSLAAKRIVNLYGRPQQKEAMNLITSIINETADFTTEETLKANALNVLDLTLKMQLVLATVAFETTTQMVFE